MVDLLDIEAYLHQYSGVKEEVTKVIFENNLLESTYDEWFPMYDFDEIMDYESPSEIARKICYGGFNIEDEYFHFDGYGNLESSDEVDTTELYDDEEIVECLVENWGEFSEIDDRTLKFLIERHIECEKEIERQAEALAAEDRARAEAEKWGRDAMEKLQKGEFEVNDSLHSDSME